MEKRTYTTQTREAVLAQIQSEGRVASEDAVIDLVDGDPTNMFFMVQDAPPTPNPTYEELLEAYNIATGGVPE